MALTYTGLTGIILGNFSAAVFICITQLYSNQVTLQTRLFRVQTFTLIEKFAEDSHFMHFRHTPAVEKNSFSQSCLARINVSRNSNVSNFLNFFKFLT